ncbi:hypothetical protein FXE80_01240 [Vibrio cholerae]|nr:hypothetical protein FXE80_01240 [Vibrio cholerae]
MRSALMCSEKTEQLAALVAQDRGARKAEELIKSIQYSLKKWFVVALKWANNVGKIIVINRVN